MNDENEQERASRRAFSRRESFEEEVRPPSKKSTYFTKIAIDPLDRSAVKRLAWAEMVRTHRTRLARAVGVLVDDRNAAFLAEGRIRQHQIESLFGRSDVRTGDGHERMFTLFDDIRADAVQLPIHRAEPRRVVQIFRPRNVLSLRR